MRISDRSRTDFERAKIKLTVHFDHRPIHRYFEPCYIVMVAAIVITESLGMGV
jgi:hypothetical protein